MVTDFHTHVLPGMDDGSASVSESIAMLREAFHQGITHVVATPHFYPQKDSPEEFLRRRQVAEDRLREQMARETDLPSLSVGAEVYFFPGMSNSDTLSLLTIGKNRYIMLELVNSPWSEYIYQEVQGIYEKQGLTPIIAHVDRYIRPFRTYGIPYRLEELPVLVQANADFFLNRRTASLALRLLKSDRIHLLGSDCHNLSDRAPNMGNAAQVIARRLGAEALERIGSYEQVVLSPGTDNI
ncbi:MAG: capsular polysaccharide biosynthesis protein [Ruminococcaceae bacterium]|nr:capsular polysaccharide biosynthesis protein [Oscillospiraceae bacterium]